MRTTSSTFHSEIWFGAGIARGDDPFLGKSEPLVNTSRISARPDNGEGFPLNGGIVAFSW